MKIWKTKTHAYVRSIRIYGPPEFHGWRGVWAPHHERKRFLWWTTDRFSLHTDQGRNMAAMRGVRGL